jgi:hypothetical protein
VYHDEVVASPSAQPWVIGRYQLFGEIASGGMATVHYGRMTGPAGFARTVAIKRLHPQFAKSPEFVAMLIDEARLAARIQHPNVVSTLDIVTQDDETLLVMDYVQGVTLAHLLREAGAGGLPPAMAVSVLLGSLDGLHSAHEARSEGGAPLGVVHRDVSPQNIIVGADGVARVADFGIAKAAGRIQTTHEGQVKGKTAYMAPEQIRGRDVDRRTDVYAASVVLWEALAGRRLFTGESPAAVMNAVLEMKVPEITGVRSAVPVELGAVVSKGLCRDPGGRFETAREMAEALEGALRPASTREVGDWVTTVAAGVLGTRARRVADMEASGDRSKVAVAAVGDIPVTHGEPEPNTTTASLVSDAVDGRRKRSRLALAAGVALVAVVGTAAAVQIFGRRPQVAASAGTGAPSATDAPALATAPALAPSASAPAVSTASAGPAAAPSESTAAPPKPPLRAPGVGPRPPPLNCNPPYVIDAKGSRHWKNGC